MMVNARFNDNHKVLQKVYTFAAAAAAEAKRGGDGDGGMDGGFYFDDFG